MTANMEDATLKISQGPGMYRISTAANKGTTITLPEFGVPLDRMQNEPPSTFVDSESLLAGRFDILGKYGLVERVSEHDSSLLREARKADPPPTLGTPLVDNAVFFKPLSGRLPQMPCYDIMSKSFFRTEKYHSDNTPSVSYRPINDTRLSAKDSFKGGCTTQKK